MKSGEEWASPGRHELLLVIVSQPNPNLSSNVDNLTSFDFDFVVGFDTSVTCEFSRALLEITVIASPV